ncbi:MAG TPA: long-chain fatty acid--CoA ligase [Polyangiaceae bacterium]|nr:long-chain fatty acid--CoA ligase [Polyangiaceae bacterium]
MTLTDDFQPELRNLVDLLNHGVGRFADRQLFGVPQNDGSFEWKTFGEFARLVDQFRAGLAGLGVQRGDRVAVISNNRLEWAVGANACYGLGASYVPMYEAQLDEEWKYILADSGAKVCLVADSKIEARIHKMESALPALEHVICFDGEVSNPNTYAALMALGATHSVPALRPDDSDIACLIYTSGTTGKPKGVRLTHFNLASNVSALLTMVDMNNADRGVSFLPWAHVFGGCVEMNLCIATGGSTVICADPTKLVEYLPRVKPTILFAVPRVWNRIYDGVNKKMATQPKAIQWVFSTALKAKKKRKAGQSPSLLERFAIMVADKVVFPKITGAFGGNLRFACSGAAALSREVAEFMESLGIEVYEGYGMTETSGCTTAQPMGKVKLGSVGKAIPGIRLEIDKTALGSHGEDGEIIVHGMGVMPGYYNLEEVTRQTMTPDGGLRTGDLGHIDEEGYLFITGRVKELYKLENGKYVAPAPLEEKLTLSPYIAQCVIFGSDKPHNVALIVPDMAALSVWAKSQGITVDGEALLGDPTVRRLLETEVDKYSKDFKGFERLRDFVLDTDLMSMENGLLTPTLKLKRAKVVAKYQDVFDSLYPAPPSNRPEPRASYIREIAPARPAARSA